MTSKEITLIVHKAKDIHNALSLGTMDPYCKVYFDSLVSSAQKSNFCAQGGRNPSWDSEFKLTLVGTERVLNVELYHKGLISDDFIGRAKITMSQLNELISMDGRPNWFRAYRGSDEKTEAGDIMLSSKPAVTKPVSTTNTTATTTTAPVMQQPVQQQQQYMKSQPVMAGQPMMQMQMQMPMVTQPQVQQPMINYQQYPQQQTMMQQQQPQQYVMQQPQVYYMPVQQPIQTTNMQMSNVSSWQPQVQSHQVVYVGGAERKDPQPAVQLPPGFNSTPQVVYMAMPVPQQYSQPQIQTQQVQQPLYYGTQQPMMQQQYQPINYYQMPYQPVQSQSQAQPAIQMPFVSPTRK